MRIKGKGKSILTRQRLPVLGLFEGLLDKVSGAAAAYSIRLLRADYSDGLLRVRAYDGTNDQGEADVRPYKIGDEKYVDLNSPIENLDSNANGRGLSNSDTLGDLVDSGGSNYDGFVPKWYEQSPNANHATNSTASEQPQIVSAGNLITENGKPALKFVVNDNFLLNTNGINSSKTSITVLFINKSDNARRMIDIQGTDRLIISSEDSKGYFYDGGFKGTGTSYTKNQQILGEVYLNKPNTNGRVYNNNTFEGNFKYSPVKLENNIYIGSDSFNFGGTYQELIFYAEDKEADRSTFVNSIDGFYNMPNF